MKIIEHLNKMRNHGLANYVIPGLNSYLIGGEGFGKVRIFENTRWHFEPILPHSHRYDLLCLVIQGAVHNKIWTETDSMVGDHYAKCNLLYNGAPGDYELKQVGIKKYYTETKKYIPGDWYHMDHNDIHSIMFDRGSIVMIFESKQMKESSTILLPHVNGVTLPMPKIEDWMYGKIEVEV